MGEPGITTNLRHSECGVNVPKLLFTYTAPILISDLYSWSYPAGYLLGPYSRVVLPSRRRSEHGAEPLRRTSVARFGTFEVSFDSDEVRRVGLKIRVQQQPLKLLQILLGRPGGNRQQGGTAQPAVGQRKLWRL